MRRVRLLAVLLCCFVLVDYFTPDPRFRIPGSGLHGRRISYLRALKLIQYRLDTLPSLYHRGKRRPPAASSPPIPPAAPAPPLLFSMAGAVELQLCRDRWQEFLRPHHVIRVWRASSMDLLAELPVPLVVQIVTHYLSQAGLTAAVMGLQALERKPLASAPPRAGPPRVGSPSLALQASRRAARQSRAGRAGRKPSA